MKGIRWLALLFPALLAPQGAAQRLLEPPAKAARSAFAIVLDRATWDAERAAVEEYKHALEEDGLATWVAVDRWKRPEAIRDLLRELHQGQPPIEGALLVGAIPVPMLRDAQHLTTAFKMDQERFERRRSSVPSDRFYEDFDLAFSFLGKDEKDPLLCYYSLLPESAQRVEKEIYSGRLMAPAEGDEAHAMIRACLQRFARKKREQVVLDRAITFVGHGYLSESLNAWEGMAHFLREELPQLYVPGGWIASYQYGMDTGLKEVLLRELGEERLDLAILHHHGGNDTQYLLGAPPLPSAATQVAELRRYLRSRLRRARKGGKSEAELEVAQMKRLGVPLSWFERAFDEDQTRADEAIAARKDITAKDLEGFACGAEVLVLDSCFNGRFIERPNIAARYLFGPGETVVCVANSVNVAQDVWADRNIAMIARGNRIGAWHRLRPHLESHLLGDPTFHFGLAASPTRASRAGSPEETLRADPSWAARLAALEELARRRDADFEAALPAAAHDPFEMIRRKAIALMGDVGREEYLEPLVRAALADPSERVVFKALEAIRKFDPEAVRRSAAPLLDAEAQRRGQGGWRREFERSLAPSSWIAKDLAAAGDREQEAKKRIRAIRGFRLYRVHRAVPVLCALARRADDDPGARRAALETLGWFVFFRDRAAITAACAAVMAQPGAPAEVLAEARKTQRRIAAGANDPLLP